MSGPIILDGRVLRDTGAKRLTRTVSRCARKPALAILQVGNLSESSAYIDQKKKFGERIGVRVLHKTFPESVTEEELVGAIESLNSDRNISGIIVQLPIPPRLNTQKIIDAIASAKDVDGLTSENKGRFAAGKPRAVVPATARGVLALLVGYGIPVAGRKVTVIGRSALVGGPIARLLSQKGATVTVCDKSTPDIPAKCRGADIIVAAAGVPRLVTASHVSAGQVIVDVGINSVSGENLADEIPKSRIVGDVDFDAVKSIVAAVSPVPGGVGPMTVLSLFENLLDAYERQK